MIAGARALVARCDLLGLEPLPLAALALDLALLLVVAGVIVRRLDPQLTWSAARRLLAAALVVLTSVVLPVTLLGTLGGLTPRNLWWIHLALAAAALAAVRPRSATELARSFAASLGRPCIDALAPLRALLARRAWHREQLATSLLLVAILGVLGFYVVLALFTLPLNFDANTYRLPRVALWLQEGSTRHLPTNEPRLNYVGQNADLVMLWLVGFFRRGYPLVHLAQLGGGLLACVATYEIGRQIGYARRASLAAVVLLLGVPASSIQFFTAQTDVFTAGCLAAGLAFLLPALRSGRLGEWVLLGAGGGLAIGAKGTVLYWLPGLALLLLLWARSARSAPWRVLRGVALAAAVSLPLCAVNFVQNYLSYGNPFAPARELRGAHGLWGSRADRVRFNVTALVWQQLEPGSNPLLPERLRQPPERALRARVAELAWRPEVFLHHARAMTRRPNEDTASFGILVPLLALVGGGVSALRWLRGRAVLDGHVAALALAVAGFVGVFCTFQIMNVHQLRYFAMLTPAVALVAARAFAGLRRWPGRLFAALVLLGQILVAVHVGRESQFHGLPALRDPAASGFHGLWRNAREQIDRLGSAPARVGVALYSNTWIAPYLRTGVGHRYTLLRSREVEEARSLGELLSRRGLDALLVDLPMVRSIAVDDVAFEPAPRILQSRRQLARRLAPGETPRPTLLEVEGFTFGNWSRPTAALRIANWHSGRFALRFANPSPIAREVEVWSGRAGARFGVLPRGTVELAVEVHPRDTVSLRVTPPYVPAETERGSRDRRSLGLRLESPALEAEAGWFLDGWTAPEARLRTVNWLAGVVELELANPSVLVRTVVARSAVGETRLELAPGGTARLALPVMPLDEVTLAVSPPLVPAEHLAGSDDARTLGVLLDPASVRPAPADGQR
jgi:4-amino-4-deoxy-L-arabinose transferase-like glycosyltransferase